MDSLIHINAAKLAGFEESKVSSIFNGRDIKSAIKYATLKKEFGLAKFLQNRLVEEDKLNSEKEKNRAKTEQFNMGREDILGRNRRYNADVNKSHESVVKDRDTKISGLESTLSDKDSTISRLLNTLKKVEKIFIAEFGDGGKLSDQDVIQEFTERFGHRYNESDYE